MQTENPTIAPATNATFSNQGFHTKKECNRVGRFRHQLWAPIVGILVLLISWAPVFRGTGSLLAWGDATEQTFPWWQYSVAEIQHGRLPLWDPYTAGGHTHVGEGQTGVFYPPFLAIAAVGGEWARGSAAIHAFAFGHAVLALLTAYALARALGLNALAGVSLGLCFALGQFFARRAFAQLNIFNATAWVPLIILAPFAVQQKRKLAWALPSGIALALSILAGHAQPAFHAVLMLACACACSAWWNAAQNGAALGVPRAVAVLVVVVLTGALLSSVQLLPMVEYQSLAYRWVGAAHPFVASERLPFEVLAANPSVAAGQVVRGLFTPGSLTDAALYVGTAAIVLALIGLFSSSPRTTVLWAGVILLGALCALGKTTPVLHLVYSVVPFADKVREPVRYLLLVHLGVSVLASIGVHQLTRNGVSPRFALGAILVALLAFQLSSAWTTAIPQKAAFAFPHGKEAETYFDSTLVRHLHALTDDHPGSYRLFITDPNLPRNVGERLRVPTVNGYGATRPIRVQNLQGRAGWFPPARAADMLGIRFVVSDSPVPGLQELQRWGTTRVFENPHAFPLAWGVTAIQPVADDEAALSAISTAGFDPRRTAVILQRDSPAVRACSEARQLPTRVSVETYEPGLVRLVVAEQAPVMIVTSEPWFPGWSTSLSGSPLQTVNVDYAFRGFCVPAPGGTIELRYEPLSVRLGFGVTLLGVFGCLLWAVVSNSMSSNASQMHGGVRST